MALFKRTASNRGAERKQEAAPAAPEKKAEQMSLSSGRIAGVFLKFYQWIISVNLSMDAYQIESGTGAIGAETIPLRGFYHNLLAKLAERVLEEQREEFEKLFSPDSLRSALAEGHSVLAGTFCACAFDSETASIPDDLRWYEFRAEWMEDTAPNNFLLIFRVRKLTGDLDDGRVYKRSEAQSPQPQEKNWDLLRANALLGTAHTILFEYDVANDCLYSHRSPGNPQGDRVEEHFLKRWTAGATGWSPMKHPEFRRLFRAESGRQPESAEILYRAGGVVGAPSTITASIARRWSRTGSHLDPRTLDDVDDSVRQTRQNR
jgi:hypothetical protein